MRFLFSLFSIWGWLKKAALSVFSAAVRYPWQAALIVAVVAAGWLWRGKQHALAERDAARAQIVALVKASDENRRAAEEQVKRIQAQYDATAQEAQHEYETQLVSYRDAANRYYNAHRLPRMQANQCAPATSGESPVAPRDNGPGEEADMVAISKNDLDQFIENTHRLEVIHAWGEKLQTVNLAEKMPEPAFGR